MDDYDEFKILFADPVSRAQLLAAAGLSLSDDRAAELLASPEALRAFYLQVRSVLERRHAAAVRGRVAADVAGVRRSALRTTLILVGVVVLVVLVLPRLLWG